MYIPRTRYGEAYESIVTASRRAASLSGAPCSVLLIPAMDVDALLACRMLAAILERDCIAYRIHPVSGWKELGRVSSTVLANGDFRSVVLLNVGGSVDIYDYLQLPEGVTAHVIDSHRPYTLENLFHGPEDGGEQVVIWDDGDIDEDMQEEREAFLALQYEPESESDEDSESSDEEDEEELDSDGEPRKRVKLNAGGQPRLPKRERRRHRTRLRKYYGSGTHYGLSVAGQMYILVTLRGCQDNDSLWMAILGLTHQFTSSLIDRDTYDAAVVPFSREVVRINVDPLPSKSRAGSTTADNLVVYGADDRNIRQSEELRLMLFRHWNLYDSMFHSGYVAGKLKLWRERGKKNLQGMLAKMGFSLQQCQQAYSHMDVDLKRSLRPKVDALAPEYGLFDLSFTSFLRAYGYQSVLSASDCVEALSAMLEAAEGVRLNFAAGFGGTGPMGADEAGVDPGQGTYWDGGKGVKRWTELGEPGSAATGSRGEDGGAGEPEGEGDESSHRPRKAAKEDVWWVKNFWYAWDALSADTTLLRSALPLSMALHRSVMRQGTSLLDKRSIKTLRSFRLAVIKEGPELSIFTHPATLARLGLWLVDAVRDLVVSQAPVPADGATKAKRPKGLPFVLASLDETRDAYLIVGINGAVDYGDVRKSKFGLAFEEAAHASGARARHDRFEESVCEVRKDDLMAFVEKIHLAL